jgi:pSer/pThr/pTyr-binding forkhead associated (FHA) protein
MKYRMKIQRFGTLLHEVELSKEKYLIGRSKSCDITVEDEGVSRKHIILEIYREKDIFITDLGSVNGTSIGDNKLKPNERVEYNTFFLPIELGRNVVIIIESLS